MKLISKNKKRIDECCVMKEYHTDCSLKAMNDGNKVKAKEHARKAQAYQQEIQKLVSQSLI